MVVTVYDEDAGEPADGGVDRDVNVGGGKGPHPPDERVYAGEQRR